MYVLYLLSRFEMNIICPVTSKLVNIQKVPLTLIANGICGVFFDVYLHVTK